MTTTLICDCNQTMPLNAQALGEALQQWADDDGQRAAAALVRTDEDFQHV